MHLSRIQAATNGHLDSFMVFFAPNPTGVREIRSIVVPNLPPLGMHTRACLGDSCICLCLARARSRQHEQQQTTTHARRRCVFRCLSRGSAPPGWWCPIRRAPWNSARTRRRPCPWDLALFARAWRSSKGANPTRRVPTFKRRVPISRRMVAFTPSPSRPSAVAPTSSTQNPA